MMKFIVVLGSIAITLGGALFYLLRQSALSARLKETRRNVLADNKTLAADNKTLAADNKTLRADKKETTSTVLAMAKNFSDKISTRREEEARATEMARNLQTTVEAVGTTSREMELLQAAILKIEEKQSQMIEILRTLSDRDVKHGNEMSAIKKVLLDGLLESTTQVLRSDIDRILPLAPGAHDSTKGQKIRYEHASVAQGLSQRNLSFKPSQEGKSPTSNDLNLDHTTDHDRH